MELDKGIQKLNKEFSHLSEEDLIDMIIYSSMEVSMRNDHLTPHGVLRTVLDCAPDEESWDELRTLINLERSILE